MSETVAERVAGEGVGALDKRSQEKINAAREMVNHQAKMLEDTEAVVRKLDAGDRLSSRDRRILIAKVGLKPHEIEERHSAESDPRRVERYLRTPEAHFYVRCRDNSLLKVIVMHGEDTRLIPDTDDEYDV